MFKAFRALPYPRAFVSALLLLFSTASLLRAVPAPEDEYEFTQPDGTKFKARIRGDEFFSWRETVDGRPIVRDERTKRWHYAQPAGEGLGQALPEVVGKDAPRVEPWRPKTPRKVEQQRTRKRERSVPVRRDRLQRGQVNQVAPDATSPARKTLKSSSSDVQLGPDGRPITDRTMAAGSASLTEGNIAILLATFADRVGSQVTDAAYFENLLFSTAPDARSMANYYRDVSNGQFSVTSGPSGISGWWVAPQPHAYYGANTSAGTDEKAPDLVRHTVAAADATFDFGPYDTDNDGFVDLVAIVHQGTAEAFGGSPDDIWPHQWSFTDAGQQPYETNDTNANGVRVKVNSYFITSEINNPFSGTKATMGVFAHEFGHALGLPDLYDRDKPGSAGLGAWCLMAGGANNFSGKIPAYMSAWCRWELGWTTPIRVTTNLRQYELPDVKERDEVLYLWKNGADSDEYFLVENRQATGWDYAIPGSGLLIYHCDDRVTTQNDREWWWTGSQGSTTTSHYLVALEQADGLFNLERVAGGFSNLGDDGDPFVEGYDFDTFTIPSSRAYNTAPALGDTGQITHVAVRNISPAAAVMKADIFVNEHRSFPEVTITDPIADTLYNVVNTIAGFASGIDVKHVKVALQESKPGGRWWNWAGNAWGTSTFNDPANLKVASGTSSWSVSLPELADGAYTAFAQAFDSNDTPSGYVSVNFRVQADTTAPTITILNPEADAVLASSPTVSGTTQDNVGIAEKRIALWSSAEAKWYRWSTGVFEDADFSFETSVYRITNGDSEWSLALPAALPQGRYEVHVQAVDTSDQGSAWVSRAFSLVYQPVVTIGIPSSGLFTNAFPEISGTAEDKSGTGLENGQVLLTIYRDGQFWNGTAWQETQTTVAVNVQPGGYWSYPVDAAVSGATMPTGSGMYAINVAARDNSGNWSQPVAPGHPGTNQIFIDIDSEPPHLQIASPVSGALITERLFANDWFRGTASDSSGQPTVELFIRKVDSGLWWTGTTWHFSQDFGRMAAIYATQGGSGNGTPASQNQWIHPGRLPHVGLHFECMQSGNYEFIAIATDRAGNTTQVTVPVTVDYKVSLPNQVGVRVETPAVTPETVTAAPLAPAPREEDDDRMHEVFRVGRDAAGNLYSLVQRRTRTQEQFGATFPSVALLKHNAAGELQWAIEREQQSVTVESEGVESTTYFERFSPNDEFQGISSAEYDSYYTVGDMKVDAAGNTYVALNVATLQWVQYATSSGGTPLFHYAPVPVALTVVYKFDANGSAVWRRTLGAGSENWYQRHFVKSMEVLSTGEVVLLLDNSTFVTGDIWTPSYVLTQTLVAMLGPSTGWVARLGYGEFDSIPQHLGVDSQDAIYAMSTERDPDEGQYKTIRKFSPAGNLLKEVRMELCDLPENWSGFAFDRATGHLYFGGEFYFPWEVAARHIVTKVDLDLGEGEDVIAWRAYGPVGSGTDGSKSYLRLSANALTIGSDGTASNSIDARRYWSISRFSLHGALQWNRTYQKTASFNSSGNYIIAFDVDDSGNVLLAGALPKENFGADLVLSKFSDRGDLQFVRLFPDGTVPTNYSQILFEPNAEDPTDVVVSGDVGGNEFGTPGFVRFSNPANTTLPITIVEGSPADQGAAVGDTVTFGVLTEGGTPWSYQWRKHDAGGTPHPLSGADQPAFTLSNVQPEDAGQYSVLVSNGSGSVESRVATLSIFVPVSLPEALDNLAQWTTGGDKEWRGRMGVGRDGDDGAVSGAIDHNQSTWIEAVFTGPGVVSFDWKVSSEFWWDALSVSVDDVEIDRISGEVDWETRYLELGPGEHTVRWTYQKDGSESGGSDTAYLDAVIFTADADMIAPTITKHPESQGVQLVTYAYLSVEVTGSQPLQYQWYRNDQLLVGQNGPELWVYGGSPDAEGSYYCVVSNRKGSATSDPAVITLTDDLERPQITLTSPAIGTVVSSETLVISGTASDNEQVQVVLVYVTHADESEEVIIADGTTSWQTTVTLKPGVTNFYVLARDVAGNYSFPVYGGVIFDEEYDDDSTFSVRAIGPGTVMEIVRGRAVQISPDAPRLAGSTYTFQAKPLKGQLFVGWRVDGALVSTNPKFTTTFNGPATVRAVFIENRWGELRGSYAGLIRGVDNLPSSTGYFNITVAPTRVFTGKLRIGSHTLVVRGKATPDGQGLAIINKKGLPEIRVQLTFDATNPGNIVNGQLTVGGQLVANFTAERAVFHKKHNPAPMAGEYTLLLPHPESDLHGYATMSVSPSGTVKLAGTMPDGTAWSHGTTVSEAGRLPLFAAFTKAGGGVLAGNLTFDDQPGVSDVAGTAGWSRTAMQASVDLPIVGSAFVATAGQPLLPGIDSQGATLDLEDGNLAAPESIELKINVPNRAKVAKVILPALNPLKVKFTVKGKSGLLSGSFIPAGAKKRVQIRGVLFQKQSLGAGLFFNGDAIGSMSLTPKTVPE